jgi:propanol-preferring alcohol dehydrogenase
VRAQVIERPGEALRGVEWPVPDPGPGEVLLQVLACGVCRTDLHERDGELVPPRLPVVPGHEIVGRVVAAGPGATRFGDGARVGVPWLGAVCGTCGFCTSGRENLCDRAEFTGFHRHGGYAEYCTADERFCVPLPESFGDLEAAPLLCAGLIGYRSLVMAGDAGRIGLYGFGAAAHILAQVLRWQGREVFAFTRPGDERSQAFARRLGAVWAGDSTAAPPVPLGAAIIFAPVGALVPLALRAVAPGGTVVCGGIHMSDIPAFPYEWLWRERSIRSVANLTRRDAEEFFPLAAAARVQTQVTPVPLEGAEAALARLREGELDGAIVLEPTGAGR